MRLPNLPDPTLQQIRWVEPCQEVGVVVTRPRQCDEIGLSRAPATSDVPVVYGARRLVLERESTVVERDLSSTSSFPLGCAAVSGPSCKLHFREPISTKTQWR